MRPEERPLQISDWEPHLLSKNAPVFELPLPVEFSSSEVAESEAVRGVKHPESIGMTRECDFARVEGALNIATKDAPYENSLGMAFVPVPGTDVLFSVWDTRVKDYAAFVSATSYDAGKKWRNPGFQQTSNDPVVDVKWEDSKAFSLWLTAKERAEGTISQVQAYRLPTDAEWSTAVGLPIEIGNTPREKDRVMENVYPWGTQWPPPKGAGNYNSALGVSSFLNTSPVGSFTANRFGLYDMGGNVWQWCEDWYDGEKKYRVLRGGSWNCFKSERLLSSGRYHGLPSDRFNNRGFRCVLAGGSAR